MSLDGLNVEKPFYTRQSLIVFRFSFDTRGAKEKLTKENAEYATGEQVSSPPTL